MNNFLTNTGVTHKNNPGGAASPSTVSTTVITSPIDPASKVPSQDYPIEKLFLLKECFTKYADFVTGDFLVSGGVTYAVRAVWPWPALGDLDTFYHLILEQKLND